MIELLIEANAVEEVYIVPEEVMKNRESIESYRLGTDRQLLNVVESAIITTMPAQAFLAL